MTSSLREQTHRSHVVRVLLLLAFPYQAVESLVAVIERISRQHWSTALFYLYPTIVWSTCLLIFWRMPDLRQLPAERREALGRGLPPERLGSLMMVAPIAMIIGLLAERVSYSALHRLDQLKSLATSSSPSPQLLSPQLSASNCSSGWQSVVSESSPRSCLVGQCQIMHPMGWAWFDWCETPMGGGATVLTRY